MINRGWLALRPIRLRSGQANSGRFTHQAAREGNDFYYFYYFYYFDVYFALNASKDLQK